MYAAQTVQREDMRRGRAEGYGARKERTGSDRTETYGRHGKRER